MSHHDLFAAFLKGWESKTKVRIPPKQYAQGEQICKRLAAVDIDDAQDEAFIKGQETAKLFTQESNRAPSAASKQL